MIESIVFFTALAISVIAAYYSIVGLTTIFSSSFWSVAIMGSFLELGKIVSVSWLYRNWEIAPKLVRYYLIFAIAILMMITSMGIFGFLSKAHIDQTVGHQDNKDVIAVIEQKIQFEQSKINDTRTVLAQLDDSVNRLTESGRIRGNDGAIAARASQKEERQDLTQTIEDGMKNISDLKLQINELEKDTRKIEAEIGPLKYIAELIYGESAQDHISNAVRGIIILLVCVFDPLAIILLISANISFKDKKKFTTLQKSSIMDIVQKSINSIRKGEDK